ncbi:MAG TPA: hypothetical protein ENI90_00070, partial [Methylothermaceae bacterium]|nr:hypothetical protein [Methylothermaceae bacterium]
MSNFDITRGAVLATAVAAFFTAGCASQDQDKSTARQEKAATAPNGQATQKQPIQGQATDQATEVKVACFGINACKGQSDCATPNNACKGMNQCKGQGFKYVSLKECEAQGGKVITPS